MLAATVSADWKSSDCTFQSYYLASAGASVPMSFKITRNNANDKLYFAGTATVGGVTRTCTTQYSDPNYDLMIMGMNGAGSLKAVSAIMLAALAAAVLAVL